jgi:hypothetical protein
MAAATAITYDQGKQQFPGVFSDIWRVKATLDLANAADGVGSSDTVAVPGVALGDAIIAVSFGVDLAGMTVTAYVSAANVVTIRVQNESGGAVDLASTTIKLVVGRFAF